MTSQLDLVSVLAEIANGQKVISRQLLGISQQLTAAAQSIHGTQTTLTQEILHMAEGLDEKIATLTSDVDTLTAKVVSNNALLTELAADYAAARAAAANAGATDAQLAALDALHTKIVAATSSLDEADSANAPPAPAGEDTQAG